MSDTKSEYFCYRVSWLPAGVFGESYVVIATILESEAKGSWECYFLSKRLNPTLLKDTCDFEVPAGQGLSIDVNFLRGDAKMQVETFVASRLEQLANTHNRPEIIAYNYELEELDFMPLHNLWFRGDMHDEIKEITGSTQCGPLKAYLDVLVKSTFNRRPGNA